MGLPLLDGADGGVADDSGGDEIGLADAQGDDVIHRGQEVEEAPDPGRGEALDAPRDLAASRAVRLMNAVWHYFLTPSHTS